MFLGNKDTSRIVYFSKANFEDSVRLKVNRLLIFKSKDQGCSSTGKMLILNPGFNPQEKKEEERESRKNKKRKKRRRRQQWGEDKRRKDIQGPIIC